MFHANMLKKYNVRQKEQEAEVHEFGAVVIEEQKDVEVTPPPFTEFSSEQKETYRDVNINSELSKRKKQEIQQLLVEFADILRMFLRSLIFANMQFMSLLLSRSELDPILYHSL